MPLTLFGAYLCVVYKVWISFGFPPYSEPTLPTTIYSPFIPHHVVQFSSVTHLCPLFATPSAAACQASLSITSSQSLLKRTSVESVMPCNHLILCRPLPFLPSIFPSTRVFSNASVLHIRWPQYWSFSFSIHPSNEYSGLISFRMDWLDLLAVQGTLKSLVQRCSPKASMLQCSAFFIVFMMWLVSPLSSVHFPHVLVCKPDLSILPHGSVYLARQYSI